MEHKRICPQGQIEKNAVAEQAFRNGHTSLKFKFDDTVRFYALGLVRN